MNYLEKYSDEELFKIFGSDIEEEIKSRGYEYGWYKPTKYAGEIYILINPAFSNLVKIGYADNVQKRVKVLNSNSGLPDPYHVYATYKVKKRLEDMKLHTLIDSLDSDLRHSKNREFYEMTPKKAYEILSVIAEINGDEDLLVLNPLNDDWFKEQPSGDTDKSASNTAGKPATIKFLHGDTSDYRPFTTWKDYTVQVVRKAVAEYGLDAVKLKLLDAKDKTFHTKKRDAFADKETDAMKAWGGQAIADDLWFLTNYSARDHKKFVNRITELFPNAGCELIYS